MPSHQRTFSTCEDSVLLLVLFLLRMGRHRQSADVHMCVNVRVEPRGVWGVAVCEVDTHRLVLSPRTTHTLYAHPSLVFGNEQRRDEERARV